jgi:hypothetical protein
MRSSGRSHAQWRISPLSPATSIRTIRCHCRSHCGAVASGSHRRTAHADCPAGCGRPLVNGHRADAIAALVRRLRPTARIVAGGYDPDPWRPKPTSPILRWTFWCAEKASGPSRSSSAQSKIARCGDEPGPLSSYAGCRASDPLRRSGSSRRLLARCGEAPGH